MPTIHNTAYAVTLATGAKDRLGKSFIWSEEVDAPRFTLSGAAGRWMDDGNSAQQSKYLFREFHCEPSLASRLQMRREILANPGTGLITGVLNDKLRQQLVPFGNGAELPAQTSRNKTTFIDVPRAFMVLDIDKLNLSAQVDDVFTNDGELPDILADLFDRAGLDWLICDSVMTLSSSHGIRDPQVLGAHLDYHLKEPLTLAEQKHVAAYINERAAAAGIVPSGSNFVDPSIYTQDRLLFTAPPLLRQKVKVDSKVTVETISAPGQRIRLVQRGQARLEIPSEALGAHRRSVAVAKVRQMTRAGYSEARAIGTAAAGKGRKKLQPGMVHSHTRDRIYAAVSGTPSHRLELEKRRLSDQLTAEVMALPDNDEPGKLEQRLREVSGAEFDRAWAGAVAQRYSKWRTLSPGEARSYRAPVSVDGAREALAKQISRAIRDGIEFAHTPPEGMVIPRPRHILLSAPPGLGKTEATLAGVKVEQLMSERISYLAPSIKLAEEATERMRKRLPTDEYAQSRVRHHKGRSQLCKQPDYNRLAQKVEALGASPLKSVCGYCPRRDACPWPAQHGDNESGLVFGQHAHAVTTLAKIRDPDAANAPAVGVIDESMLSTLLREWQKPQKIDTLRKWSKRATVRRRDGEPLKFATIDLIGFRTELLDILAASKGVAKIKDFRGFRSTVYVKRGEDTRTMHRISAALDGEHDAMRWYNHELNEALKAYHEAIACGRGKRAAERRITDASANIKIINWFIGAFQAVKGSLGIDGREHVFGMRITPGGKVALHIRAELPSVMRKRSWIWLDGTADPAVWKAFLGPDIEPIESIPLPVANGPYRLYQYADRPYGKRMFKVAKPKGGTVSTDISDTRSNLSRLHRFIKVMATRHSDVLFVAQKDIVERLRDERKEYGFGLPANVHTGNFNALRGLDAYRNVPCAIIVGQPLPRTSDLEVLTEALHYDNPDVPQIIPGANTKNTESIELTLANGQTARVEAIGHPDPHVRAMRRQIVDAEVKQALHRLRLFDRTESNPAEIHLFGQTDTGLVVTELRDWRDADYDQVEAILEIGIISGAREIMECILSNDLADGRIRNLCTAARKRFTAEWRERKALVDGVAGVLRVQIRPDIDDASAAKRLQALMRAGSVRIF